MSLIQGFLILMLRPVFPCWILVVSRSLPPNLGRERGILLANHPTNFLSIMSVWTNVGHGGGECQGLFGRGLDQVSILKTITVGHEKVEWAPTIPGHSGGPLGSGMQTWSRVQFLPSFLSQHLNSLPFAGMILVQALSHHLTFKFLPLWFLLLFSQLVTSLFACQYIFLDSCSKPLIIAKNTCYSQRDETGSMITKFSYGKIDIICQRPNLIARKPSKINAKQLTMANKRVL